MGVRIGKILVDRGFVTEAQLQEALRRQKESGGRFGEILIEMGALTQDQLNWALGEQLGIPYAELSTEMVDLEAAHALPEELLRRYQALPVLRVGDELTVALADPTNRQAVADIEALTSTKVTVAIASASSIARLLDLAFPPAKAAEAVRYCEICPPGYQQPEVLTRDTSGIAAVYSLLLGAVRERATEIHIEPQEAEIRVRYRVPEGLRERARFPAHLAGAIASRLRILAGVRPERGWQRSRLRTRLADQELELELLFLPARRGEATTVWLRRRDLLPPTLGELGLPARARKALERLLRDGGGFFLVSSSDPGSRAAGLYALARAASGEGKRVLTVERVAAYDVADFVQVETEEGFEGAAIEVLSRPPDVALIEDVSAGPVCLAAARAAEQGRLVVGGLPFATPSTAWHHVLSLDTPHSLLAASLKALLTVRREGERWTAELFPVSDRTRQRLLRGPTPWTLPTS